jgi:hypothetical protein
MKIAIEGFTAFLVLMAIYAAILWFIAKVITDMLAWWGV